MKPRNSQHGFVLAMTLVLLMLAAVAFLAVSRASMDEALTAVRAGQELQRRWGTLSCTATLMPKIETLLSQAAPAPGSPGTPESDEASRTQPVTQLNRQIVLGEYTFDLILSDEQAKVNVNTLLARRGAEDVEYLLPKLCDTTATIRLNHLPPPPPPEVKPAQSGASDSTTSASPAPLVGSYDQIFPDTTVEQWLYGCLGNDSETATSALLPGAGVTCWGSGKLNFTRASDTALEVATAGVLDATEVHRLLDLRSEHPQMRLADMLTSLGLEQKQRRQVESLLTDQSQCHSLWIVIRSPQRNWYHLTIDAPAPGSSAPPGNTESSTSGASGGGGRGEYRFLTW